MEEDCLPQPLSREQTLDTRESLHRYVLGAAKKFFHSKHRQALLSMNCTELNMRLYNSDDQNKNPFGVTAGDTDLFNHLEQEADEVSHSFSIDMGYSRRYQPFVNDVAGISVIQAIEFETKFVHELVNNLRKRLRRNIANVLVNGYLGLSNREERDYETLHTNIEPVWREGVDIAWMHYEVKKLQTVYFQICEGNFIYHEKKEG